MEVGNFACILSIFLNINVNARLMVSALFDVTISVNKNLLTTSMQNNILNFAVFLFKNIF